jgi:hypothetical protein
MEIHFEYLRYYITLLNNLNLNYTHYFLINVINDILTSHLNFNYSNYLISIIDYINIKNKKLSSELINYISEISFYENYSQSF